MIRRGGDNLRRDDRRGIGAHRCADCARDLLPSLAGVGRRLVSGFRHFCFGLRATVIDRGKAVDLADSIVIRRERTNGHSSPYERAWSIRQGRRR